MGLAGSKMLAKIGSEQAKPDGLVLIEPGTERELLGPMPVRTLPGVGPATGEHLRRAGMTTVAELAEAGEDELVRLLGKAHGASLYRMALGHDDRPVVSERETKSVSVEDTFDVDLHDRVRVRVEVERLADRCVQRLRAAGHSGRTVVLKVRRYDFSTLTRSETLRGPTDDPGVVREAAGRLLESVDTTGGVRLLGVGVTGLADFTQEDLFAQAAAAERPAVSTPAAQDEPVEPVGSPPEGDGSAPAQEPEAPAERRFPAGHDVLHAVYGAGWVQGSGLRRVTVRFEEPGSAPGRVKTFWVDDPELALSEPLPLVPEPPGSVRPGQPESGRSSSPRSSLSQSPWVYQPSEVAFGVPFGQRRGPLRWFRLRLGQRETVVVVELELLLRGEMAADAEVGGVLDQRALEGHLERVVHQRAGCEGDEGVTAEEPGTDRRPLRYPGGVVQIHLVHRAEPVAIAVERLAAYQTARIDIGLHGPSNWSHMLVTLQKCTTGASATRQSYGSPRW